MQSCAGGKAQGWEACSVRLDPDRKLSVYM